MATDRTKLEYEIATAANGEYLVRIRAPGNRATLAHSETYKDKDDALRMIEIIRANAADGEVDDKT